MRMLSLECTQRSQAVESLILSEQEIIHRSQSEGLLDHKDLDTTALNSVDVHVSEKVSRFGANSKRKPLLKHP